MEGDSIRTIGDNTLVDVWIAGKVRSVSVTKAAIAAFLDVPEHQADVLTEERRKEFMRTQLSRVVAAAKERLLSMDPSSECVTIDSVVAASPAPAPGGDRRQGDRRKGERRKLNLGPPPSGERRKGATRRS